MRMLSLNILQKIVIYGIPLVFAITLHEAAHGYVAYRLGDNTAFMLGRLTLNPIKHMDILGTLVLPMALFLTTGFVFGWAKPVPINVRHLRRKRMDTALVAAAGPCANLLMAYLWALIVKGASLLYPDAQMGIVLGFLLMGRIGITVNIILCVLNLLPIPPLDGSRILASYLPYPWDQQYLRFELFGLLLIILLLYLGVLWQVIAPLADFFTRFILKAAGF